MLRYRRYNPGHWAATSRYNGVLLDCTRAPGRHRSWRLQLAQRKYCRYCGERRLGLLAECRDEPRTWECRDDDGCDYRKNLREQPALAEGGS